MLGGLVEKIQSMAEGRPRFDPVTLNDPIAVRTAWTPAKNGGTNVRTHKLVRVDDRRVEFRPCAGALCFYLIFLLIGLAVALGVPIAQISNGSFSLKMDSLMPMLIGLIFTTVGGCMFYFGTAPIVLDTTLGYYWKGRRSPDEVFDKSMLKYFAELENVHALQLVSEYCSGNKSSFYSYELNLVLEDGQRVNVVDHGSRTKLREDADALSHFLGKPVWDAI